MTHTQNNYSRRCRRGWCFKCSSMALSLILIIFILQTGSSSTAAIQPETQAKAYLTKYGYLDPQFNNSQSDHLTAEEAMSKAILEFQKYAGLNLTGYLDGDTIHMMSLPRCGASVVVGNNSSSGIQQYASLGRWQIKDLTYKVTKYTEQIDKSIVDSEIERAFKVWSDVTPLNFRRKTGLPVHIEIRFEKYGHGDSDPFDGLGGTVGHATIPMDGGNFAHFDDSEKWTIKTTQDTNLFQVAVHEFGHSLGLYHSHNKEAIMHGFYNSDQPKFQLHEDDIGRIQALYGSKRPKGNDTPINNGSNALCKNSIFDAIFTSTEGKIYVFKGPHYWELTEDGVADGYPKMISENWIGLPDNIDTAFTFINGLTYFFKGSKYWIYDGTKSNLHYYPRNINDDFTGIPNDVQASTTWSGGQKIYLYFFKGDKYWVYDPSTQPPVKSTYPKLITESTGIPHDLDDALRDTLGYVYFFKGGKYYRLNKKATAVDTVDPPYPRDVGKYWFGCDDRH